MKISEDLPQFPTERALLIVTGTFHGDLYEVHDGTVEHIRSIEVERPAYSDREEHFETRSHGKMIAWGAAYEDTKDHDRKVFMGDMERALQEAFKERDIDTVFLFSPEYNAPEILDRIPNAQKDLVRGVLKGNYTSKHLFELLKMIKELEKDKTPELKSEEAQKIYDKPHQRRQK